MARQQKYFNNNKPIKPYVKNRRDADKLLYSAHKTNMLLTLTILHDKYGFGKKRANDFLEHFEKLLDSYNHGNVNANDLNQVLIDELGIKVV